jgi:hypothetical protein
MTTSAWLAIVSVLIALGALLISRESLATAVELNRETRDTRDVATINSCNQRYLDWRSDGPKFNDVNWCYGMWDLLATEFSLFRQGWLPPFMFRSWMNTLGAWYADQQNAWPSHQSFLATYSGSLTEMEDFFQEIWRIARDNQGSTAARNRKIEDFVDGWHAKRRIHQI